MDTARKKRLIGVLVVAALALVTAHLLRSRDTALEADRADAASSVHREDQRPSAPQIAERGTGAGGIPDFRGALRNALTESAGLFAGPGRVEGTVLDATSGQPVPYVDVVFRGAGIEQVENSGADGRYRTLLPPGTYEVRGIGDDVIGTPGPRLRVRGGEQAIPYDVRVNRRARVRGRVVDAKGRGVPGADVRLAPVTKLQKTMVNYGDVTAYATTDTTGAFTLAVMPANTIYIEALEGDRRGHVSVEGIEAGEVKRGAVITLFGGTGVSGTVVAADGAPASGAVVHLATEDGPFRRESETTSDSRGRFELRDVLPGTAWIEARKPGFAASAPSQIEIEPGERHKVQLALQHPLVIAGHVIDPFGKPVAGARVRAGRRNTRVGSLETYTDDDGRYRFDAVDSGPYWVGAYKPGYAIGEFRTISPPLTDLELRLPQNGRLSGRVVDQGGRPIQAFEVVVEKHTRVGQKRTRHLKKRTRHSDPNGTFELHPLEPGDYELRVVVKDLGEIRLTDVEIEEGETTEVTATLP